MPANEDVFRPPAGGLLDLFRILQKSRFNPACKAPLIATVREGEGYIGYACCDRWDCPRCKFVLAAYHLHRMAEGTEILMQAGPMYFWTLTCRGRDLDLATADDHYYEWTNRLLNACRYQANKKDGRFQYVQVTERQKRGAAHSHLISTFLPRDAIPSVDDKGRSCFLSEWFTRRCESAGLGPRYSISAVRTAGGAARYISGYLQKQLSTDTFPRKWKRIRYSRQWPDTALAIDWGTTLDNPRQWRSANRQGVSYLVGDKTTYQLARHRLEHVELATLE